MNPARSFAFSLALGVASLACAQTPVALPNPGLESGGSGWSLYQDTAFTNIDGSAMVSYPASGAHGGVRHAQVRVFLQATQSWHVQLQLPLWTCKPQNRYRVSFWAKGASTIHLGVSDATAGYAPLAGFDAPLTAAWSKYSGEFVTSSQSGLGAVRLNLFLGGDTGTYAIDDVELLDLGPRDLSWFPTHQARIDTLRRGPVRLTFTDSSGAPLAGASVSIRQLRHSFPFGTALSFDQTHPPRAEELWYRQTAAKHFNAGVFENDFKWPVFEPTSGRPDTARIATYLKWADSLGWELRGHALVWPIQLYGFDKFWGTDTSRVTCGQLASNIQARILRDVAYHQGRIREYDVWNEPLHERAFFAKCADDPRFAPAGEGLMDSAFAWARAADPSARLYINEYDVVTNGGATQAYHALIRRLLYRGVPIDGIGVQGHLWKTRIDPARIREGLDLLATLGKPIKFTEFDMGSNDSIDPGFFGTEAEQAQQYAEFVRAAFSHPAVAGIYLWGFWDKRHWIPWSATRTGGGIYRAAKTAKPAADSLAKLWNEIWSTRLDGHADTQGIVHLTGYYGTYEVTARLGDRTMGGTFVLEAGKETRTLTLSSSFVSRLPARERPLPGWRSGVVAGRIAVVGSGSANILVLDATGRRVAAGTVGNGAIVGNTIRLGLGTGGNTPSASPASAGVWTSPVLTGGIYTVVVRSSNQVLSSRVVVTR